MGDEAATSPFREELAKMGRRVVIDNKAPIEVTDPGLVYLVAGGRLVIFATEREGAGFGERDCLMEIPVGEVFFGIDPGQPPHTLIASGVIGTEVIEIEIREFQLLAIRPEFAEEVAGMMNNWVECLGSDLADSTSSLQIDVILDPGETPQVEVGDRVGSTRQPVWVTSCSKPAYFLGKELFDGKSIFLPLAGGCWISLDEAGEVTGELCEKLLRDQEFWDGMQVYQTWYANLQILSATLADFDEINRQLSKRAYRDDARADSVASLVRVVEGDFYQHGAGGVDAANAQSDELLLEACREVGKAAGVVIRRHPDIQSAHTNDTNLRLVAKSSRFRLRRVLLEGQWWKKDIEPMLGYRAKTGTPVALVSGGSGKFILHDPIGGAPELITEDVAATLRPVAETFYRGFPDGPVDAKKFLKFAMYGLRGEFILVALLSLGAGLLGMLTPFFTSKIFDSVIPSSDKYMLWQYVGAMVCAAMAATAFEIVRSISVLRVEGKMDYAGQSAIWSRMLDLPLTFFRKFTAGDLASRAYAIDAIRSIVADVGVTTILGTTMAVFQGIMMFIIDPKLAFFGVMLVFAMVILIVVANFFQLRLQRQEYEISGRISGLVLQFLTGVTKIRVAAAEDHAFRVWAKEFASQKRVGFVIGRIQNFVEVVNAGFPIICSMVLFALFAGINKKAEESGGTPISTGQLIAFNTAFTVVLTSIVRLGMGSLALLEIVPIFQRVKPILTEEPEVTDKRRHPGELRGNIELYKVNFRYTEDGPLILKNLDLKINKGEFVALVGTSGSGKSTVLRLLLGFEKPESGYVYYEGQDLESLDLREVRRQIGAVLQTSQLMPTTIFANIVGANAALTETEAHEAARMSGLDRDIEGMPMKMHTVVSEGGGGFSGGQKQRLMIARALVMKPRMVFFDEATSALDNRTQSVVTQSLKDLDATRITIAHRLSTVVDADRIIVMDQGAVAEEGTYHDLIEQGGIFADLARSQQL